MEQTLVTRVVREYQETASVTTGPTSPPARSMAATAVKTPARTQGATRRRRVPASTLRRRYLFVVP